TAWTRFPCHCGRPSSLLTPRMKKSFAASTRRLRPSPGCCRRRCRRWRQGSLGQMKRKGRTVSRQFPSPDHRQPGIRTCHMGQQRTKGEVRDICVREGGIVSSVDGGRTIEGTGMIVFPGGVDVHTHVAGAALNSARAMIPEDHRRNNPLVRNQFHRGGIGGATPTTYVPGHLYPRPGYTTRNERAPPSPSA